MSEVVEPSEQRIHREMERLEKWDADTRRSRAVLSIALDDRMTMDDRVALAFVGGGSESAFLRFEALRAYTSGNGAAALVLVHAVCERELAGWVQSLGATAPKGWARWGLGPLVRHALAAEYIPDGIARDLYELNERRRLVYHFQEDRFRHGAGSQREPSILTQSMLLVGNKDEWRRGMSELMLTFAFDGISAMVNYMRHVTPSIDELRRPADRA